MTVGGGVAGPSVALAWNAPSPGIQYSGFRRPFPILKRGADPILPKREPKPTVADLSARCLRANVLFHCKQETVKLYRSAIDRLLGHRRVETTAYYAHLARDSVKESAERIAVSIAADIW